MINKNTGQQNLTFLCISDKTYQCYLTLGRQIRNWFFSITSELSCIGDFESVFSRLVEKKTTGNIEIRNAYQRFLINFCAFSIKNRISDQPFWRYKPMHIGEMTKKRDFSTFFFVFTCLPKHFLVLNPNSKTVLSKMVMLAVLPGFNHEEMQQSGGWQYWKF